MWTRIYARRDAIAGPTGVVYPFEAVQERIWEEGAQRQWRAAKRYVMTALLIAAAVALL